MYAAGERRLLVIVEDLHWADAPTIRLMRELARRTAGSPVLVSPRTGMWRRTHPVRRSRAGGPAPRSPSTESASPVFDRSETAALIAARAVEQADVALAERLCEQTGGNPFFIEELMRSLAEAPEAARVPEGVKEVIGGRLDRLPPPALEALTLAAVLGIDFRLSALRIVASELGSTTIALAEARAGRGSSSRTPRRSTASRLRTLVRETLYERPIASRQLRLHLHVAQALEAAPFPVHPGELAHHYFQARHVGGAAKAVVHSLRAAEAALAVHAYEDGAEQYERALAALEIVSATTPVRAAT